MKSITVLILSGLFVLAGCTGLTEATPTATAVPSPTATATQTATPTAVPQTLGERQIVEIGGFSIQPVLGYETSVAAEEGMMFMADETGDIVFSFVGLADADLHNKTDLDVIDEYTVPFMERGDGNYEQGESYTVMVGGVEGTAVDITGELFGRPIAGQAVYANPMDNQIFFTLAFANQEDDDTLWTAIGSPAFAAMLESVEFSPILQSSDDDSSMTADPCPISTDPTYGYSETNPILVGGDAFDGPPRETAYLDNLLGPNGEAVFYERAGSVPSGDTILDIFTVNHGGESVSVSLYLDEYNWSEPQAPVGFTCAAPFSLTPP